MNLKRKAMEGTAAIGFAILILFSFDQAAPVPLTEPLVAESHVDARPAQPVSTLDASPVLVELFTSEGCSSCPPADKVLAELDDTQPVKGARVIALSEHVDYWNHLGWKDPFSSAEFSRRQAEYARVLGVDDIFTPQMIVDGRAQFVGSNGGSALDAIAKAARSPKAGVSLTVRGLTPASVTVGVRVENVPEIRGSAPADIFLAITEGGLSSSVVRGENSGRKLAHTAVTRKLIKIGAVEGKGFQAERAVDLDSRWKRPNIKAVAFVQERSTRTVLGAAAIKIVDDNATARPIDR